MIKFILPIFILLFLGCNNQQQSKKNTSTVKVVEKNQSKTLQDDTLTINLNDTNLTFKKDKLIYPNKRVVILFEDNSSISKAQEMVLDKLNVKYSKTQNQFLKEYFQIKTIPTIIVLDKNKTIKYENFVPYEILKAEGF